MEIAGKVTTIEGWRVRTCVEETRQAIAKYDQAVASQDKAMLADAEKWLADVARQMPSAVARDNWATMEEAECQT